MSEHASPAAGWYPDPSNRFEHRYWDSEQWTAQVSSRGEATVDTLIPPKTSARDASHVPASDQRPEKIQSQVERKGLAPGFTGGGTIYREPVLVVNQKAKLIELNNEYAVYDADGRQIAAVRQVGQSFLRKALRLVSSVDQFLTRRLQVCDLNGTILLDVTRPAKIVKSKVIVSSPESGEIGTIIQENVFGKIRFGLEARGRRVGSINAENWRAWNFNIQDEHGVEIARITKTWGGLLRASFTTADNYVVQIHRPLEEPLRSIVVAAAVCVDTALKQDDNGFSLGGLSLDG